MSEVNLKEATRILTEKRRKLEKSIAKLIDDFEEEVGKRIGDQDIRFSYVADGKDRYIASVDLKLSI